MKGINRNKGFTLVELAVVFVLIAILIALLIPSMSGWIARARQQAAVTECRGVVLATEAVAAEKYGADEFSPYSVMKESDRILSLAEAKGELKSCEFSPSGELATLIYVAKNGVPIIYRASTVEKYALYDKSLTGATAYLGTAGGLDIGAASDYSMTKTLQQLFRTGEGGFPSIEKKEKSIILTGKNYMDMAKLSLSWKPVVGEGGAVFLIATESGDDENTDASGLPSVNRFAYIVFSGGDYYYFADGEGNISSKYIPSTRFDLSEIVKTEVSSLDASQVEDAGWVKYEDSGE